MRSFAQSHSFWLVTVLFCLVSPSRIFGGVAAAAASEVSKLNNSEPAQNTIHASAHNGRRRRHAEISGALVARDADMMLYPGRRAAGASFTHFVTGLGACGHVNSPSDFIVAISKLQYEGGKHCGETITITAKGKTAQATIMDECMGCGFNDIDLTDGLYRFFDPSFIGAFTGDWEFGSGGPAAKPPPATPTKKPAPPPPVTTTSQVHHTTSSSSKSSVRPTSSKASSSTVTTNTSQSSSSTAVPTATNTSSPSAPATGNLGNLFDTLVSLGGLIVQTVPPSS